MKNKKEEITMEMMEAAAIECAKNFGTPDISGGFVVSESEGLVRFLDKNNSISMTMTIEAFENFSQNV